MFYLSLQTRFMFAEQKKKTEAEEELNGNKYVDECVSFIAAANLLLHITN